MNDTKVAALLKPSTQRMHNDVGQRIIDVLTTMPYKQWTRNRLADAIGKPINCVTAPIKQLLDSGIIVEHERVKDELTQCLRWTLKLKKEIE